MSRKSANESNSPPYNNEYSDKTTIMRIAQHNNSQNNSRKYLFKQNTLSSYINTEFPNADIETVDFSKQEPQANEQMQRLMKKASDKVTPVYEEIHRFLDSLDNRFVTVKKE